MLMFSQSKYESFRISSCKFISTCSATCGAFRAWRTGESTPKRLIEDSMSIYPNFCFEIDIQYTLRNF